MSAACPEMRLYGRALRERWPTREEKLAEIWDEAADLATAGGAFATDENGKKTINNPEVASVKVAAMRVLVQMSKVNIDQERLDWERQRGLPTDDYPDDVITEEMAAAMRRAALEEADRFQLEQHGSANGHAPVSAPPTPPDA